MEKTRVFEKVRFSLMTSSMGKTRVFKKVRFSPKGMNLKRGGVGPSPHCLLTCFSG